MLDVPPHLEGRDLLRTQDWHPDELRKGLDLAAELKRLRREGTPHALVAARTIGMIFDKPSTRTRVSFSAGMAQLGGTALTLPTGEMQLGRGNRAGPDAIVTHDLTARYGEEITEGVLHGPRSAAPDQAENRMHAKKTLLALAIG